MAWSEQLFRYCERGSDPAFWAEPVNAVTNLAFIVAAAWAATVLHRAPKGERGGAETMLVGLVFAIGIGSFLFHTFATRWASLTDVVPITIFMLAYFGYAMRRFVGLSPLAVGATLALFVAALWYGDGVACQLGFMPVSNALGVPCLNGTAGYLPGLVALLAIGTVLVLKQHAAAHSMLLAGAVFAISMAFRTVDIEACAGTTLFGIQIGTHFLWHLLNAVVLYLLLRAALLHGRP